MSILWQASKLGGLGLTVQSTSCLRAKAVVMNTVGRPEMEKGLLLHFPQNKTRQVSYFYFKRCTRAYFQGCLIFYVQKTIFMYNSLYLLIYSCYIYISANTVMSSSATLSYFNVCYDAHTTYMHLADNLH